MTSLQLSETNVKTISQRCYELITKAACIDQIRTQVVEPVLEYYAAQTPARVLGCDSVYLAWRLLRQGGMLCLLLNNFRTGLLQTIHTPPIPIADEQLFTSTEARSNVKAFLAACKGDLYMTEEQLFSEANLFTDDTNTLSKAIALTDSFFSRIARIQAVNYEKRFEEIAAANPVYSLGLGLATDEDGDRQVEMRLRVLREVLESEQKYVADLDKLQNYAEELRIDKVISAESHKAIFANLDSLVDFQRRFLLQMESKLTPFVLSDLTASYGADIGTLFTKNENAFAVYETFCSNFRNATETVTAEIAKLAEKERVMEPNIVLRAFLIKPTQRICKYPLLLRELLKYTPEHAPDRHGVEEAMMVSGRIAARVNEKKRLEEMKIFDSQFRFLVKDWKDINPKSLGALLLKDTATIASSSGSSRDLEAYLYERTILMSAKAKSMSDLFQGTRRLSKQQYVIKGYIDIARIRDLAILPDGPTRWPLKISYYGPDTVLETLEMTFNLEEKRRNWISMLEEQGVGLDKPSLASKKKIGAGENGDTTGLPAMAALTTNDDQTNNTLASSPATMAKKPIPSACKIKIHYQGDTFITVINEPPTTIKALRNHIDGKLKQSAPKLAIHYDLSSSQMILKYIDTDKDEIVLLDDSDLHAALLFTPGQLNIRVSPPKRNSMNLGD